MLSVPCGDCGKDVPNNLLRHHEQNECVFRPVNCPKCSERMQCCDLKDHLQLDCPYMRKLERFLESRHARGTQGSACVKCGTNFGKHIFAREMKIHQKTDCEARLVSCPNKNVGCIAPDMTSRDVEHHLSFSCAIVNKRNAIIRKKEEKAKRNAECKRCGAKVRLPEVRSHELFECRKRLVSCPRRCEKSKMMPFDELKTHLHEGCRILNHRAKLVLRHEMHTKSLEVCPLGCGKELERSLLESHRKTCDFQFCACHCGASIRKVDQHKHQKIEVIYESNIIPRCRLAVKRKIFAKRAEKRSNAPGFISCPKSCGTVFQRRGISNHLNLACPNNMRVCEFTGIRCQLNGSEIPASEIGKHLKKCNGARLKAAQSLAGQKMREKEHCTECGLPLERKNLKKHAREYCSRRKVHCRLNCGSEVPFNEMEKHIAIGQCLVAKKRNVYAAKAKARLFN